MIKRWILGLALVASVGGCGKQSGDGGGAAAEAAAPAKPANGAPMVFVASDLKVGDNFTGGFSLKGYNFADKPVDTYQILMRYTDASGKALKVKPGTSFEKDFDFYSLAGRKYACAPKHWCDFKLDHLDVPVGATTAEVVPNKLTATGEQTPFYDSGSSFDWPK